MNTINYILCDIEGTTSSISFVVDTLFPYFREHFRDFVAKHAEAEYLPGIYAQVRQTIEEEEKRSLDDAEILNQLDLWSQEDRKHPALKSLQGYVWREGYAQGALKGHIYPDVAPAFQNWKSRGISLGIYSSGSVQAQKLLFSTTEYGDLCPYFSHHFDTRLGHKKNKGSYVKIALALNLPPQEILFLSDVAAELDAAREAGFCTCQLLRPGTQPSSQHPQVANFSQIQPEDFACM